MSSTNYFAPPEKRLRLNNQNQKFYMKKIFYSTERQVSLDGLLIRKARHGRVSGTRDNGWQLTLKVFASEGIDWQKAFVEEPIEVMTDLMGPERMSEILKEALKKLEAQSLVEKDWKPFGVEW